MKISRNNDILNTANSFFNQDKINHLTFNNIKNNSLIINNDTEKKQFNIDNSILIKEKEEDINEYNNILRNRNAGHSVEKRDIKLYIKKKNISKK